MTSKKEIIIQLNNSNARYYDITSPKPAGVYLWSWANTPSLYQTNQKYNIALYSAFGLFNNPDTESVVGDFNFEITSNNGENGFLILNLGRVILLDENGDLNGSLLITDLIRSKTGIFNNVKNAKLYIKFSNNEKNNYDVNNKFPKKLNVIHMTDELAVSIQEKLTKNTIFTLELEYEEH